MNDIVKLALDIHNGSVAGNYSKTESDETLRMALIDANGGKSCIDPRAIRDGECTKLFQIMEEIITLTSEHGLQGDEFFMNCVEYRNKALGDSDRFYIPDDSLFVVSELAEGSQSVRRQKLEGGQDITVSTRLHAIKVYEEMNRLLAGRVDINDFIDRVGRSFAQYDLNEIYSAWTGAMAALKTPYSASGTFDEDKLLDIIDHIEAETGETATVYGTRRALRKINTAILSDQSKDDMYAMGYFGKFNGTNLVRLKQRHKVNSSTFVLPDNELYIMAGDQRFVKHVTEGDTFINQTQFTANVDLTQEYLMIQRTGNAVVMANKTAGIYKLS